MTEYDYEEDIAAQETEDMIAEIEEQLKQEYQKAIDEIEDKIDEYLDEFRQKDIGRRQAVADGEITQAEYNQWRQNQMMIGVRWEDLRNALAMDMHNVNQIAKKIYYGYRADVYAVNYNWATYNIEHDTMIDTSFTLYSRETVERLIADHPDLMPPPGKKVSARIAAGQDVLYNKQMLNSALLQDILQGKSIDEFARDIARKTGEKNYSAAVRNARTMVTGAQNAGRINAYRRAEDLGIRLKKRWIATLDGRTRPAHAALDGQTVPVNEPFESELGEIMYPGDPSADPANVWNCRCTTISVIEGFEIDSVSERTVAPSLGGISYEEWKELKKDG